MKKTLPILPVLFLFATLTAFGDGLGKTETGLWKVEKFQFGLTHWGLDWKLTSQRKTPEAVSMLGEGGIKTDRGIRRDGVFRVVGGGSFDYTEIIDRKSDTEADIVLSFKSAEGVPTSMLNWTVELPVVLYQKHPAVFNGKPLEVGNKELRLPGKPNGELVLNLEQGKLVITGNFSVTVHRNSWGIEVRLNVPGYGRLRKAELSIHLKYTPYSGHEVNLAPAVNMGFRDEVADDGKGGWTDQGPGNDLSAMKPGEKNFGGIPFAVIDPEKNDGRSCLAMKGETRPNFPDRAEVAVPKVSGEYLYLLNGVAWAPPDGTVCGEATVIYDDGSRRTAELKCGVDTGNFWNPTSLKNAVVVWKARNGSAEIGLYATAIPLDPKKKVAKLEFRSRNQVWMIVAATISNRAADAGAPNEQLVMKPDSIWLPFEFRLGAKPGSIADFSGFADAPAGKYGFLRVGKNGTFEFEKRPGTPVRFWGQNLCFNAHYMEPEQTRMMLDDLAAMGSNAVRLHHFDWRLAGGYEKTGNFDPECLRKLDYLAAEAAKRGLYLTLDLYTVRPVREVKKYGTLQQGEYKTLCYFDEEVYQSLLSFAKNLFGHRNEFTGTLWKDDPAIVLLNFLNESTLPVATGRMTPRVKAVVDAAWEKYAAEHRLLVTQENRETHFTQFLADSGMNFYRRLKKDLNDFGVRIPFSDQNFANTAGNTRALFDYVDTHFYWGHPQSLGASGKLPSYTTSMSSVAVGAGGIRDVFFTRVMGKPMTVTEWNYCYPNPHNAEGPVLTAAYAALQGYAGLWQFDYSHPGLIPNPQPLGAFDTADNPVMKLAFRAGMLLFLRGDVQSARTEIPVLRTGTKTVRIPRIGLIVKTGSVYDGAAPSVKALVVRTEDELDLKTRVPVVSGSDETEILQSLIDRKLLPSQTIDFKNGITRSETGELTLNQKAGIFSAATPYSEAFVLPEKASGNGGFMKVRNLLSFGVFFAGSLDGAELRKSKRVILMHLTDLKSQGAVFRDPAMNILENAGEGKYLIRRGKAEITLNSPEARKLFACAADGERLFEVPFVRNGGTVTFTADTASPKGPVTLYELIK